MSRPSLPVTLLAPLALGALLGGCAAAGQEVRPGSAAAPRVQRETFVRTVSGVEVTIAASELGLSPAAAAPPAAVPAVPGGSDDGDDGDDDDE